MASDATGKLQRDLERAIQILSVPEPREPEEWMLVATLIGEADLVLRRSAHCDPSLAPLLARAVADLRDVTRNFTDADFLRSSRAARRRNPELFDSRS